VLLDAHRFMAWQFLAVLSLFVCARSASAQDIRWSETKVLGAAMSVERLHIRTGRRSVAVWRATGFALGPEPILSAYDFAGARGGRVVAIVHGGAFFTDDRGSTWQSAQWDGSASAVAAAFDSASGFGVAGGEQGTIWTTDDRGEHWQRRREREHELITAVATVGRAFAFVTVTGGASISSDGGLNYETVLDSSSWSDASLRGSGDTLDIVAGGTLLGRLTRAGEFERGAIAPR